MKINSLPAQDRPREKLINSGTSVLSDSELLAIILNNGGRGQSAIELAQNILKETRTLTELLNYPLEKLICFTNIGLTKAVQISALKEITLRCKFPIPNYDKISSPSEAFDYIKPYLADKDTEHLYMISLNSRCRVISKDLLSVGTINETLIHPREIIKTAISHNAVSIILAHNHPSGETEPSKDDVDVTHRLETACSIVGVGFIDHLIVYENSYLSMRSQNLLKGGDLS